MFIDVGVIQMQTELRVDPGITSPERKHEDDRLIALILERGENGLAIHLGRALPMGRG
jgi:hypothetical protein